MNNKPVPLKKRIITESSSSYEHKQSRKAKHLERRASRRAKQFLSTVGDNI